MSKLVSLSIYNFNKLQKALDEHIEIESRDEKKIKEVGEMGLCTSIHPLSPSKPLGYKIKIGQWVNGVRCSDTTDLVALSTAAIRSIAEVDTGYMLLDGAFKYDGLLKIVVDTHQADIPFTLPGVPVVHSSDERQRYKTYFARGGMKGVLGQIF